MIHPWLRESWRRLVGLGPRLPHALLFTGPAGLGKRDLGEALAARLLCGEAAADGEACGRCTACTLRLAGNHPDLFVVVPAADAEAADGDDAREAGERDTAAKKKSTQIVIEQIRDLQQSLMVTGHQSSRRVVVLDPAEAMNAFTANALLKLLEEPPEGCVFVLVSSAPRRLLPTIRSRCQQWSFARPSDAVLAQWLAQGQAPAAELVALASGMPLAAERLAAQGAAALLARFARDVAQLPASADPVKLAGQWDAWLKSKEALAAGFGIVQLVDWMQRWVADLASLRLGARVRFFPSHEAAIAALARPASVAAVLACYNELARIRRVAQHPLNTRLMLEDMLLRYARALNGPRP